MKLIWRVGYDMPVLDGAGNLGIEVGETNLFGEDYFDRNANKGIVPGPPREAYVVLSLRFDF